MTKPNRHKSNIASMKTLQADFEAYAELIKIFCEDYEKLLLEKEEEAKGATNTVER